MFSKAIASGTLQPLAEVQVRIWCQVSGCIRCTVRRASCRSSMIPGGGGRSVGSIGGLLLLGHRWEQLIHDLQL